MPAQTRVMWRGQPHQGESTHQWNSHSDCCRQGPVFTTQRLARANPARMHALDMCMRKQVGLLRCQRMQWTHPAWPLAMARALALG